MKKIILLCVVFLAARGFAADGVSVFQSGLQAFQTNGADALLHIWYSSDEDAEKVAHIRRGLTNVTQSLGAVVDTQVFAPRNLGRHVQRLYGVIYFEKRPLWIRAEYYSIAGRGGFLSLEYSLQADDILPLTWANPNE
ncbi:hypothetical protein DB347_19810 [Opitutaceae bacterium EW11]|nr:hypothetical protein DB347_19810 [Opitutaceae bacterium EW11]